MHTLPLKYCAASHACIIILILKELKKLTLLHHQITEFDSLCTDKQSGNQRILHYFRFFGRRDYSQMARFRGHGGNFERIPESSQAIQVHFKRVKQCQPNINKLMQWIYRVCLQLAWKFHDAFHRPHPFDSWFALGWFWIWKDQKQGHPGTPYHAPKSLSDFGWW